MPNPRIRDTAGNFIDPVSADELAAAIAEKFEEAATDAELAAAIATALESVEPGDTFVTNLYESNYFTTQVINQPQGLPKLDGNGKVGKGQTRYVDAAISFILDGGGSAVSPGLKGFVRVPFDCTITAVDIIAEQAGDLVVDIWKDTYANHPPTDADSITASAPPTLSAAAKSTDATLTGWTKAVSAGDILAFNVDSAATVTLATVVLHLERS